MKASDLVNKMVDDANSPFNDNPKDMPKGFNTRVEKLTPNQYIGFSSHIYGTTPEVMTKWKREHTDKNSIDELKKLMQSGKKLDQPWLILNNSVGHTPHFQEGLHRMIAYGDLYGYDTPVGITIGTDDGEDYPNLSKMNLDEFKKYSKQVSDRANARKLQKEKDYQQEQRKDAAEYFNIPENEVTPELLKKYYKELDDEFMI